MTDSIGDRFGDTVKYLPFGQARATITITTDKLFTGQRLDGTGLYYYNARYYDPTLGRFISADTIIPNPTNPQYFNRYSYCLNNPLKYTDPSGHGGGFTRELEDMSYLTLTEWISIGLEYGLPAVLTALSVVIVYDRAYNRGKSIEVPTPYFGPRPPWEPGSGPPPWNGPDPSLLIKIAAGTVTVTIAAAGVSNMLQEADENGFPELPLEKTKEPKEYHKVTFSDGSSGYYSSDCITMMQYYGASPQSVEWTVSVQTITFSDGSSGYYTNDQISLMGLYGLY